MNTLSDLFASKFDVIEANTPELLDTVFRLRYQVYCLETGFEDPNDFNDYRERDRFDEHALHALIVTKTDNHPVATVRLVRPDVTLAHTPFPMEQDHARLLASRGYGPDRLPRVSAAEISRFAISRDFKRRAGEAGTLAGVSPISAAQMQKEDRRLYPHIILGLFLAIVRLSAQRGLTHWVAVMEWPLLRLLSRFGIEFTQVGAPINFHGLRQPCVGAIDDVLANIFHKRIDVWQFITENGHLWPAPYIDPSTIRAGETHERALP